MTYALEFLRLDGRWHQPSYYNIPAGTTPADELATLLDTLRTEIGAGIAEMSPGRYAVYLAAAEQCWSVRIVSVGDTQHDMAAVVLYDEDGNELDRLDRAV